MGLKEDGEKTRWSMQKGEVCGEGFRHSGGAREQDLRRIFRDFSWIFTYFHCFSLIVDGFVHDFGRFRIRLKAETCCSTPVLRCVSRFRLPSHAERLHLAAGAVLHPGGALVGDRLQADAAATLRGGPGVRRLEHRMEAISAILIALTKGFLWFSPPFGCVLDVRVAPGWPTSWCCGRAPFTSRSPKGSSLFENRASGSQICTRQF